MVVVLGKRCEQLDYFYSKRLYKSAVSHSGLFF